MPPAGVAVVRRGQSGFAGSGAGRRPATAVVTRCLIAIGLGLIAVQAWVSFTAAAPAPARSVVSTESIAGIQITLGQATLALREFGQGGVLSSRFDFESGMSRVRQSLDALKALAREPEEHRALDRTRSALDRLSQIEQEHIARTDAGGGAMGTAMLAEVPHLRDAAAQALTDFQEAGVRRTATPEPDSMAHLLRGAAGAGVALLGLCVGALTLWSRFFPA